MFIGLNFGMCTYVHIEKNQQPYARFRIIQVFIEISTTIWLERAQK